MPEALILGKDFPTCFFRPFCHRPSLRYAPQTVMARRKESEENRAIATGGMKPRDGLGPPGFRLQQFALPVVTDFPACSMLSEGASEGK